MGLRNTVEESVAPVKMSVYEQSEKWEAQAPSSYRMNPDYRSNIWKNQASLCTEDDRRRELHRLSPRIRQTASVRLYPSAGDIYRALRSPALARTVLVAGA